MKGEDLFEKVLSLSPGQWSVHPPTGVLSLTEEVLKGFLNAKSIEELYVLDPEPIARGQFAVVYHCTHRVTGMEYAAKFSSRFRRGEDCSAELVHEIAVSAMLISSARTVHLVDVFSTDGEFILVMEYAPGGDLQTLVDENRVPYERDVIKFLRQLLEGLVFLHDRNIVHLDIKPQNLVLMGEFPDCAVKLCDFEISRMLTPGQEVCEILGTTDYVPPEILRFEPITTRADMWSVGVLTYVLLTGFLPFGGENDLETIVEIVKCEVDFPSELFEDITPEAIDFMKKLLLRQPEQRMSARDSLNHIWMRKDLQRPKPPSTLNLNFSHNLQMSAESFPSKEESGDITPIEPREEVLPSTLHPFLTKSPSENTKTALPSTLHPILTKSPSENTTTEDLVTPSRDIGRPPLHPSTSQKSLLGDSSYTTETPVTTPGSTLPSPFIYRQESRLGSRQNLDRIRSMSKSREVIYERVQMSNLKKSLSKSRDRLFDAKMGMSKSREQLMALSSLSQSSEALSALSHLAQQNSLYQSCNNIFVPKLNLPLVANNCQGRMYQSMAAIDQLDTLNYSKKVGYFESTMSLKDEAYNNILTQRNTDMNCFVGEMHFDNSASSKSTTSQNIDRNRCNEDRRGGNQEPCNSKCMKHRQPEARPTQRSLKINKAEKMKKDAQRKKKEKREKERQTRIKRDKEKRERENLKHLEAEVPKTKTGDNPSSPCFRRGSVSHVELRIQERHERIQERLEKQEKEERKNKRRVSVDQERHCTSEKSKTKLPSTLAVAANQRSRSITPTRRKSTKEIASNPVSDVSQSSSMESVIMSENLPVEARGEVPNIAGLQNKERRNDERNNNTLHLKSDEGIESDEAYVSLEDTNLEMLSRVLDCTSSGEPEKVVISNDDENKSSSDEEPGVETLTVTEKILGFEKGLIGVVKKVPRIKQRSVTEMIEKQETITHELPVINEESSSPTGANTPPSFQRSTSNTSDFGSLISDSSECSTEKPSSPSDTREFLSPDWKGRSRSYSVYSNPSPPLLSPRSRSNSFNFDVGLSESELARPWGNICSGSVARAFERFSLKGSEGLKRSTPPLSPCDHNSQSHVG